MKKVAIQIIVVLVLFVSLSNCDEEDLGKCNEAVLASKTVTLTSTWVTATTNFQIEQSAENCSALKSSSIELKDFLNENIDCVDETIKTDNEKTIKSIDTVLNNLPC